jgi:Holliday junction resolvase
MRHLRCQVELNERDLVNKLHQYRFAVIRSPASGGETKMPSPDIIAGSKKRRKWFAFEVKTTRGKSIHVSNDSFHQLIDFSKLFGCSAIFARNLSNRINSGSS